MSRAAVAFAVLAVANGASASCGGSTSSNPNKDAGGNDASSSSSSGGSGSGGEVDAEADSRSGSSSGADSGPYDGGNDAGCVLGATQCSGNGVQTCSGGMWGSPVSCTNQTCVNGECLGVCALGSTQCSGNGVETCDASGQWGSPWPCSTGDCTGGACTGFTTTGASCSPGGAGMTNCGASSESCCTSLEVTGGTYDRTYTNSGGGPTGTADPATVSGFRLDKYEVTVGRFRQFVAAWNGGSGYTPPPGSGKHTHLNGGQGLANSGSAGTYETGWVASDDGYLAPTDANLGCPNVIFDTWTSSEGTAENLPMDCLNWYEAYAFCIWDGGFLPSEAEWEYAAAGGYQEREYPWGTTTPGTACPGTGCQYSISNCEYPNGSGSCTGVGNIAPVGTATLGAGLWGQLDLMGSVWEWSLDWYATYVSPCTDCAYLTTPPSAGRVTRGGAFLFPIGFLLPPGRDYIDATDRSFDSGFRCARSP